MLSENAKRDFELVNRAKRGDQRAFEQFMNLYSKVILFEIQQRIKNTEVANDLMMESMEKAFERLESYDPQYAFSTWLKRISINHTIDYLRVKKPDFIGIENELSETNELLEVEELICLETPDALMIELEDQKKLFSSLGKLKAKYADLVRMRYFDQLSYSEISYKTNLPEGTVKIRLYRAKALLFQMMTNSAAD